MPQSRLALIADYLEESWKSMDLCAEKLAQGLGSRATLIRAPYWRAYPRPPAVPASTAERLFNRHVLYPRFLRSQLDTLDQIHICDHSYAHLALVVPRLKHVGVFIHDLDALRPRHWMGRMLARRVQQGLMRADLIFYSTQAIHSELANTPLGQHPRQIHAPYGISEEYSPHGNRPSQFGRYLLHVGSTIARKGIETLLDTFAQVSTGDPELRLLQIGGRWTEDHLRQIQRLGIESKITQISDLPQSELPGVYRGALALLIPSRAEGFGLPLLEALASGTPVIASDLPSLREVGGSAALFCPVDAPALWSKTLRELLSDPSSAPPLEYRLARAAAFSWDSHCAIILKAYQELQT